MKIKAEVQINFSVSATKLDEAVARCRNSWFKVHTMYNGLCPYKLLSLLASCISVLNCKILHKRLRFLQNDVLHTQRII